MIVWGGVSRGGGAAEQVADGAAYDPETDAWRSLAAAPSGLRGGGGQAAAWTGSDAVFWVGNSPDGPVGTGVYDPAADSWRSPAAGPLGVREGYVSVWTGKRLLIMGGVAGDQFATPIGAGVDPATGSWKQAAALNKLTGFVPTGAVWEGSNAFVFGNVSQCPQLGSRCQQYRPMFVSYTPSTDTVQQIALSGAPVGRKTLGLLVPIAWTGHGVLFTDLSDPAAAVVTYDPASGTWQVGPPAPCAASSDTSGQVAWAGAVLVVPCGRARLQLYDPTSQTWRVLSAGPSPLNSRTSSAIAWTGTQLIVWSGSSSSASNPTPKNGATIDLSGVAGDAG
jgi:hypothetical protein